MPKMDEDVREQGQTEIDLVQQAYVYVTHKTYPEGCSKNLKWVRRKAKKFAVQDGELYYFGLPGLQNSELGSVLAFSIDANEFVKLLHALVTDLQLAPLDPASQRSCVRQLIQLPSCSIIKVYCDGWMPELPSSSTVQCTKCREWFHILHANVCGLNQNLHGFVHSAFKLFSLFCTPTALKYM